MGTQPYMDETETLPALRPATPFGPVVYVQDETTLDLAWQMAIAAYLESKRGVSGSDRTADIYRHAVKAFAAWLELPLRDASSFHAQHYVAYLYTDRTARTLTDYLETLDEDTIDVDDPEAPGPLAPASVNLYLSALRGLYDFVRDQYTVTRPDGSTISLWPADRANPFAAVKRARVKPFNRAVYPSVEELQAILDAINTDCLTGLRDYALLYTLATTCRRASAILNLRWGDILDQTDEGHIFQYHYKGDQRNEQRRAILGHKAYAAICAYLRADGRPPAEMQPGDHIFIPIDAERASRFPDIDPDDVDPGAPLSNSYANRILKKYARRVRLGDENRPMDVNKAHLHGLRHAGARLRVQQMRDRTGVVDYEEIQQLLGHSGLGVTQVYIREVCTDPTDPGAAAAEDALMPSQRRRRKTKPAPPEQQSFLEDKP